MYSIFEELLNKTNNRPADVVKATGIASSVFSEWKKGRSAPKIDKLLLIADYFGVSVDYFLESGKSATQPGHYVNTESAQIAQEIFDNRDLRLLFDTARKVSPESLKKIIQMVEIMEGIRQ